MDIIFLVIFWISGIIVNFLTCKRLHDWKDYENPTIFLCICIFLCITMSWALFILNAMNGELDISKSISHSCLKESKITYLEEYFDKDGNKLDITNFTPEEYQEKVEVHHTYKIWKCSECGRLVRKEQLQ